MFVADASTVLCWVMPGNMTPSAQRAHDKALRSPIVIPTLWLYETHNAILKLLRQKKLTSEDATDARIAIGLINKRVDPAADQTTVDRIWEVASIHMMTIYDAAYVELALRLKIPLASDDSAIQNAAQQLRIKLI